MRPAEVGLLDSLNHALHLTQELSADTTGGAEATAELEWRCMEAWELVKTLVASTAEASLPADLGALL